jgi:hypothetical protein
MSICQDHEVAKNVALTRAKERAEAEVKSLRSKQAPSSADESSLRKEVKRLEEEKSLLQEHAKSVDSKLLEAQKEIERMRYTHLSVCRLFFLSGFHT